MIWAASSVPFSVWRKIAMATWRPRKDPMISATMDIEATRLLEYIAPGSRRHRPARHPHGPRRQGRRQGLRGAAGPQRPGRVRQLPAVADHRLLLRRVAADRSGDRSAKPPATDLSGAVVRRIDEKPPWVIAKELADRAERIRHDDDPQFKQAKTMAQGTAAVAAAPR